MDTQQDSNTPIGPGSPSGQPTRKISVPWLGLFILAMVAIPMMCFIVPECERDALLKDGVAAEGTILAIKPTGNTFNDQPQVKINLEVRPKDGEAYTAETKMIINPVYMPQFQPGKKVFVRYDAEDPSKVAIEATEDGSKGDF